MKNNKLKISIAILLITSMVLTSCQLFPTQKMIDNIVPDYNIRMYTIADFIPYDYKEIKNARALYGMELQEFFLTNTTTESELKRVTKEQKFEFYKELMYRAHNYKILKKRYSMYLEDEMYSESLNTKKMEDEYNKYYDIKDAESISTIKKYNNGKASGLPLMSIRAIMSTATESDTTDIYSEVTCEIYKPVTITEKEYQKLEIGKEIVLDIPATNSTVDCKETIKRKLTYVATDSFVYTDDKDREIYCFIADLEEISGTRRILDYYGKTLETYVETKPLQFMKHARVANANEPQRLLNAVINDKLEEYEFDKFVEKALCGGYLIYKYKDYVYANAITTNLKGYITSLTEYTNQRIDNDYFNNVLTAPNDSDSMS